MAVTFKAGIFDFNFGHFRMQANAFPGCVVGHLLHVPNTLHLEQVTAPHCRRLGFAAPIGLGFIQDVCFWGGKTGYRVLGMILKHNPPNNIPGVLPLVDAALPLPGMPLTINPLIAISAIKGLGQTSYGSKVLRFLRPEICGILDRIVVKGVGYESTRIDWVNYSNDCVFVAKQMTTLGIGDPANGNGPWLAAHVDMAIFARLQGWCVDVPLFHGGTDAGANCGNIYNPKPGTICPLNPGIAVTGSVLVPLDGLKRTDQSSIDDWFTQLKKALEDVMRNGAKIDEIVFVHDPKGLPMPSWFKNWCTKIGIKIKIIEHRCLM